MLRQSTEQAAGLAPGTVVMADVAAAAGVSQKTVSRVVNGSPSVSPSVRERVNREIARLGYRRNGAARALALRRTHVIGIVTMGSTLHGVTRYSLGVERAARDAGYGVVIVSTADRSTTEVPGAVLRALELGAEGLVMIEPLVEDWEAIEVLATTPFVAPGAGGPRTPQQVVVDTAQEQGARLATEHLLDLGHRRVAHLAGPREEQSARRRTETWRCVLAERGAPVPEPAQGDWSARSGYHATRSLLEAQEFTALFSGNDQMAVGATRALHEAGLRVPHDVSVVGYDDVPEAEFLPVPLTTVRQDFAAFAQVSVDALVRAVEAGAAPPDPITVPVELVVRSSTAPPGGPGP